MKPRVQILVLAKKRKKGWTVTDGQNLPPAPPTQLRTTVPLFCKLDGKTVYSKVLFFDQLFNNSCVLKFFWVFVFIVETKFVIYLKKENALLVFEVRQIFQNIANLALGQFVALYP
jgi:hypothetical protein